AYVTTLDQFGYIRGQSTWQNPFGQAESTAFVAGFAKTFEETVRALSSLLRVHMKKSYWAFKDNGQWYIEEPSDAKAFWKIKPGMVLTDTNGQAFTLTVSAQHETWRRWRLQAGSVQPCANVRQRSRCMVSTQSLKDAPPMIGWKQRRLQIQGVMPKNVEVFVAGFLATPMGEGQWEYWGHPGSSHKALIMSQSRLLHSEVFADDSRAITVLRLPGSPIAKQSRR
ncbi:MAG: hypothetical protein NTX25_00960, partial [Proteobacteria bacterium]|nr:hypothetical protein [Pseudomonadota bacterium]